MKLKQAMPHKTGKVHIFHHVHFFAYIIFMEHVECLYYHKYVDGYFDLSSLLPNCYVTLLPHHDICKCPYTGTSNIKYGIETVSFFCQCTI